MSPGDRYGRWTVVRQATPAQRRPSTPTMRKRVLVRCMCGFEKLAYVQDLRSGRSKGCNSARCRTTHQARASLSAEVEGVVREEVERQLAEQPNASAETVAAAVAAAVVASLGSRGGADRWR